VAVPAASFWIVKVWWNIVPAVQAGIVEFGDEDLQIAAAYFGLAAAEFGLVLNVESMSAVDTQI